MSQISIYLVPELTIFDDLLEQSFDSQFLFDNYLPDLKYSLIAFMHVWWIY